MIGRLDAHDCSEELYHAVMVVFPWLEASSEPHVLGYS